MEQVCAYIDQLFSDVGSFARYAGSAKDDGHSLSENGSTPPAISGSLFPNPSDGAMILKIAGLQEVNAPVLLVISDISGRIVLQQDGITAAETAINASNLANGT